MYVYDVVELSFAHPNFLYIPSIGRSMQRLLNIRDRDLVTVDR